MTRRREVQLSAAMLAAVFLCATLALTDRTAAAFAAPASVCPDSLPLPSTVGEQAYEALLNGFLDAKCYRGWVHDREIRNTGPFVDGRNFGTHPAVRVYYSPRAWEWMTAKHRQGRIADNAIIVKEMYTPPAAPDAALEGWTTMVRDSAGAFDGWYWGYHGVNDTPPPALAYPNSGFGLYCTRCHASAESELTFSAVRNVDPAQDPLSFVVQTFTTRDSVGHHMTAGQAAAVHRDALSIHGEVDHAAETSRHQLPKPLPAPDPAFLVLYGLTQQFAAPNAKTAFPVETYDHVVAGPGGPEQFLTSDQCTGCHSASTFNMALVTATGRDTFNLSPYGEWRASLMGLAGRDPVFHAQRESEVTRFPTQRTFIDTTCYRCHGVMGQRQATIDGTMFRHDMVYATPGQPGAKYGALARDGISCMACHQISAESLGDTASFTGRFKVDPPGHVNGPYEVVAEYPMKTALGITPRSQPQIRRGALCGACHSVVLPVLDSAGKQVGGGYEQATYIEWLNSVYQNEIAPFRADSAKTCQGCHMPQDFRGNRLRFRAAIIEDPTYPMADHRARDSAITVAVRDTFSRHMLMGINLFTLAMFQQFPDTLGIRSTDYMYSQGVQPLVNAGLSAQTLAREQSATVRVESVRRVRDSLEVAVRVENLTGHRLPSGVGFRRAFVEMVVTGGRDTLWASGRTNHLGVILRGTTDQPLPTEFVTRQGGSGTYQPHHEAVTRDDQVQIYEERVLDPQGWLTTSFLALDSVVKENRLPPRGWRRGGPYWTETQPHGSAARDADYWNGQGADRLVYRIPLSRVRGATSVRATLYYQSLPPYYLAQRFGIRCGSPFPTDCAETRRLAFLASRLRTQGTPIESWKLLLATDGRGI
ncbi:hypothetical protein [Longimicrobium sp.]|uniref:hypothetical protein n=1 Tax=Longimicrobium sp. TaxID=2029185 RepID=UPI002C6086D5|nr:hypothetical protein [Longimicrobium sp.]HSU15014.1 hypothetical protein [Longimicrobium sp.]